MAQSNNQSSVFEELRDHLHVRLPGCFAQVTTKLKPRKMFINCWKRRKRVHGIPVFEPDKVRFVSCPYIFVNPRTGRRWVNPETAFKRGAEAADLSWMGFHDLRRFRACQWVRLGLDLETVMKRLGHADLRTTERYVRGLEPHLERVRQLQAQEDGHQELDWVKNG